MATRPRPLGNRAKSQVEIATDLLHHGQELIAEGLTLMDRNPDAAAALFLKAAQLSTTAENILLYLQLGRFTDE